VVNQNHISFNLSIDFSSDGLTKLIAQELKIDETAAEQLKITSGLVNNPDNKLPAILQPLLIKLTSQIAEALKFHETHFAPAQKIQQLLLVGGGAGLLGLPEYLAQQLNLKIEIAKPDLNIIQTKVKIPPTELLSYGTAIGLALRQFQ